MFEKCGFDAVIRTATFMAFVIMLGIFGSGCGSSDDDNDVTGDPGGGTTPNISVVTTDAVASESGNTGRFTISLNKAATTDLEVKFELAGTADLGTDYTATDSMTVTIAAGSTTANVTIAPLNDSATEGIETVLLTLLDSPDYTVTTADATIEIQEGEISDQTISVVATNPIALEGGDNGIFVISLSTAAESNLDVQFNLTGTATRGTDYYSTGGASMTVTIAAGTNTKNVAIRALSGDETEGTETVVLTLLDSPDYTITTADATIQIREEGDGTELPSISVVATDALASESGDKGTFTISLDRDATIDLIVDFGLAGTANMGTDYSFTGAAAMAVTIPTGSRTIDVTVTPRNDDDTEGTETVEITLRESSEYIIATRSATLEIQEEEISGPQVSVVAADDTLREGGDTGEFTIQLNEAAASALDIVFRLSGSATIGADYTADTTSMVQIRAGQTSASVVITPLEDGDDTEKAEDIVLTLEDSAAYTIRAPEATMTIRPVSVGGTIYDIATQRDFDDYNGMVFQPGDYIRFKRGMIFTGMFAPKGSGSPEQPILIGNYGTGSLPIINAMGENEAGILLKNVEQWEIDGIEVTNTDGSQDHQGKLKGIYVLIDNPTSDVMNHIHISNCYVHDVNGVTKDDDPAGAKRHGGIHIHTYGDTKCRLHDVSIVGNTVEDTGGVGIANDSTHASINSTRADQTYLWTDLYVAHNFIDNTDRNNMIIRDSIKPLVEYNILANSSRENTGHNLFNFDTVEFVAQYNEGYGNLGDGMDRGAYDADYNAIDTTYQYNYSHDNQWMIGIMNKFNEGVTIRYNISQNDRSGFIYYGFNVAFQSRDIKVYNNTYFAGDHLGSGKLVANNSVAKRTTFYNNIFYFENGASHGSKVVEWEDITFSNNAYVGIDPWDGEAGAVTTNINLADPGSGGTNIDMSAPNRLSGYRLQSNSDCINAGKTISGVTRDFWGNPVPAGATDIGAHEYQP